MDAYCLRRAVDRNKVEFHADNDTVIVPEASAEDLGLTDGASIFARMLIRA